MELRRMSDRSSDYRHEFFIHRPGQRPPFGLVVDHVYGPGANVDTEGDSYPASSTTWTWLYMQLRSAQDEPVVEVTMVDDAHTIMRIASDDLELAAAAAQFLSTRVGGTLSRTASVA
jgi:hypothetical protein